MVLTEAGRWVLTQKGDLHLGFHTSARSLGSYRLGAMLWCPQPHRFCPMQALGVPNMAPWTLSSFLVHVSWSQILDSFSFFFREISPSVAVREAYLRWKSPFIFSTVIWWFLISHWFQKAGLLETDQLNWSVPWVDLHSWIQLCDKVIIRGLFGWLVITQLLEPPAFP